jgi:hypothetical protein
MPNNGYFDIKRDIEVIKAGGFFCEACLVGKTVPEASPDPRYCQGCYEFLLKEAELLPNNKRPKWIPKTQPQNTTIQATKAKITGKEQYHVSEDVVLNMSTSKGKKSTVDIIRPRVGKRGPKKIELPEGRIKEMSKAGMGSKAITGRLKSEFNIHVSYKTIQRLLSGERVTA